VLTGILRVARESIFSGLNNVTVYSLLGRKFSDKFGLTEDEVVAALEQYGLAEHKEDVQHWYNGYRMMGREVYNPWSILQFLEMHQLQPYWINTSDNAIIEELIMKNAVELQQDVLDLMEYGSVNCKLDEHISFNRLEGNANDVWNFLFFTGYLTLAERYDPQKVSRLCLPNEEIRSYFKDLFAFPKRAPRLFSLLPELQHALKTGNGEAAGASLSRITETALSYYDLSGEKENAYHTFVLGLLLSLEDEYRITSNRESGFGRYDIMLEPRDPGAAGYVVEIKRISEGEPDTHLQEAITQIREKDYMSNLRERGVTKVLAMAVVFQGKQVWTQTVKLSTE
jgi:hypothetical protein